MEFVAAHPLTSFVLVSGSLATPLLAFGTYNASGATFKKSIGIAAGITLWGVVALLFIRGWQFDLDPALVWAIVALNYAVPSVVVVLFRQFFVGGGLSLEWLTSVQAFRFMGALFILENLRGHTGTAFAYTAGFGDVMAAVIALTLLLQLLSGDKPRSFIFYVLIAFGTIDFLAAYSLSFLSGDGLPWQVLALDETHLMHLYPLALLPYFLVPFAMANHVLMYLTLQDSQVGHARSPSDPQSGGEDVPGRSDPSS